MELYVLIHAVIYIELPCSYIVSHVIKSVHWVLTMYASVSHSKCCKPSGSYIQAFSPVSPALQNILTNISLSVSFM